MFTQRAACAAISLLLILSLTACSADQVTETLELAVDAAIAAAPAIETAAKVSPAVQAIVTDYLGAAETCLTAADKAVNATGATPEGVAADIATACGSAVLAAPVFPTGTPTAIITAIVAVADAIAKFVAQVTAAHSLLVSRTFTDSFTKSRPERLSKARAHDIHKKILTLHSKLHPAPASK